MVINNRVGSNSLMFFEIRLFKWSQEYAFEKFEAYSRQIKS